MPEPVYISVILPLKLRWVPSYRVDLPEEGGAAVPVIFSSFAPSKWGTRHPQSSKELLFLLLFSLI